LAASAVNSDAGFATPQPRPGTDGQTDIGDGSNGTLDVVNVSPSEYREYAFNKSPAGGILDDDRLDRAAKYDALMELTKVRRWILLCL